MDVFSFTVFGNNNNILWVGEHFVRIVTISNRKIKNVSVPFLNFALFYFSCYINTDTAYN